MRRWPLAMPTLTLRHKQTTASGFVATLNIDGQSQYPVTVSDPFTEQQERELEFYFEQWIRFPFDNQTIAERAAASVQTYGESLFQQIFADPDAYSDYRQACRSGLGQLQIEIEGDSPDFQALHWEALKDPKQPIPLAVEAVFTRKRVQRGITAIDLAPSPVINLLVVTARPDEEADVGYRTISRPLIEAIHRAQLRVKVEILRPGTFEALSRHLDNRAGHYHIIHFDAHGGLMTYDQFEAGVKTDRYLYKARYGRSGMERYTGQKAFLFFEGEEKGEADPVEAEELAALLTAKGIPICILNACQSAKQVRGAIRMQNAEFKMQNSEGDSDLSQAGTDLLQNSETSLGSRLMAAGVQMVVAMGYSVTVTAAQVMMEKLYAELFADRGIPEAIRLSRKELYNRKERKVYFNQRVPLEDWLLPVVYANRPVDLKLREFAPAEKAQYLTQRAERYHFAAPTYGFVGRDLEILKIEKGLLRHNVLLVQGMGGTGKTTLLNYLRDWWQTTHFVQGVFYFGYDTAAHTVQAILRTIGKALYPDPYDFAAFEAMPPAAQREDVADHLRTQPYALMLDNLESVTGQNLAIQNTLPAEEQETLKQFLRRLVGGKTKVVLGSRSGEDWLADTYTHEGRPNVYPLGGLDPESRTELAEKILAAQVQAPQRIAALRVDGDFKRLMDLLAGYPLAMEVVLANLARQTPTEILAALNAADVDLNVGGGDKTNNILKCVDYSYSNLSPQAQQLLVCLAPFSNFFVRDFIPKYAEYLQQHEALKNYEFSHFDSAIQEAINWGLLSVHESGTPGFLSIQPIFPYFLSIKLCKLDKATQFAISNSFKDFYRSKANSYHCLMESQDAQAKKGGAVFCRLEYENLYKSLKISLKNQEDLSIYRCLSAYLFFSNDIEALLNLTNFVCKVAEDFPQATLAGNVGFELGDAFQRRGVIGLRLRDFALAESSHLKSIDFARNSFSATQEEKQLAIASNYHQLGYICQLQEDYQKSLQYYNYTLEIQVEYKDFWGQAKVYHHLGTLAYLRGEYCDALKYYQESLDIKENELHDLQGQACTFHQLGMLFQSQGDFEEAERCYQKAISIKREFGDITYIQPYSL